MRYASSSMSMPIADRSERPKTECIYCGLVWQDHTLREYHGCMALMKLHSLALGGTDREVVVCPVCNKTSLEHTDIDACRAKWRKREQGSTGLELQHWFEWFDGHTTNEAPDPVKSAEYLALWMKHPCGCGKLFGDHTIAETLACARAGLNRGR